MEPLRRPHAPTVDELLVHRGWVEGLARSLVRDPSAADDLAQQAWVRILSRPPSPRLSPRAWLAAVVRSCAVDRWRSESSRAARERAVPPRGAAPPTADLVARADAHRRLLEEVLRLEPASREVVLLRFFEGLEPEAIARRLGEPGGTVRSRLHRAIAVLRERLDRAHGGDRAAWAVAILGREALDMGVRTKAAIAAAALLLLVGGVAAFRSGDDPPAAPTPAAPAVARADAPADEPPPPPAAPPAAPAPPAPPAAGETPATPTEGPAPAGDAWIRLETVRLAPREPDPPPPGFEGREVGVGGAGPAVVEKAPDDDDATGAGAGFGMTGWTKWKPVPEKGTATVRGRVVDLHGRALPGAVVWESLEGGIVDPLGRAGDDGRFELLHRPARKHHLFPEWCGTVRDAQGRIPDGVVVLVEPREGETVGGVTLRVPADRERMGSISGRVLDDEGRPARVSLSAGLQGVESERDGRFRFASVPEGEVRLAVDEYGWRPWSTAVAVRTGAESEVDIRLVPSRLGRTEIGGVVRDDAGKPVPRVPVWCGGPFGVSRREIAGEDGSFLFRRLPAPNEGESFTVSVFDFGPGDLEPYLPKNVNDVLPPARNVVVELERTSLLRIVVRDAPSGDLLPLFNVTVEREVREDGESKIVPFHAATLHEEDGAWEVTVPRARVVLFVEAPDHQPAHLAVEIPGTSAKYEVVVPLAR